MTPRLRRCLLPLLAIVPASFAQTPAAPAASSEETVELPVFNVSADKADRYAPGDSISAARIRASIADTAASISVISSEFMKDIGADNLLDATRYISGMSAGRAAGSSGILDRHVIRGFENDGRTVDNFATGFQVNFDPQFIERVEVVKGPNSILSPTGTPGGSINVITKSPKFTRANSVFFQVGRFDAQKVGFDSTGPVTLFGRKDLAFRLVGNYQNTHSFLPGRIKLADLEAAMTWKISSTSQVIVKYFGFDWTQEGAVGAANTWGIAVDPTLPHGATLYDEPPAALGFTYRGKNGVTDWSTRKNRVNMLSAEYTVGLTSQISMRLASNWFNNKFGQDQGLPSVPNIAANRYDPRTGLVTPNQTWAIVNGQPVATTSILWDPTRIARTATYIQSLGQNFQLQHDFAGNFKVGSVAIQPVAGWSSVSSVTFPNFTKTVALPTINLFAPDDNPPKPDKSTYTTSQFNNSHNSQRQVYAYTRISAFGDRLFLSGGAARIWLHNRNTNLLPTIRVPVGPATTQVLKDNTDTYLAGALFKPTKNISVYYSYSTNASGVTFNNNPLWRTGTQHEYGFKTDFFQQRLSIATAYFDIVQNNLTTPNPAFNVDPINNPPQLLSDATNKGWEIEVKGGLTKDLSVVASATSMKVRDAFGRRSRNIPDKTAGLLLNYRFSEGTLKGLGVHAGATHQGDSAGETAASSATALGVIMQPGFKISAYTLINVGGSYSYKNYSFTLGIDNVANHKGFWQAAGRGAVPPIPGTNVRLTTTIAF